MGVAVGARAGDAAGVEVAPTSAGGVVCVAGIAVARGVAAAVELSLFCV